jgi:hypothetical protein
MQPLVATFTLIFWAILIELRRIACEFAERKHANHNSKHKIKLTRKGWAKVFLRGNRELSVTISRILAFNEVEVTRIYGNVMAVSEMCKFGLHHIFSVDGSELSCV